MVREAQASWQATKRRERPENPSMAAPQKLHSANWVALASR